MELGTLQIQIFVSLVVVLGTAFVAFLCDFLKGNNEQLRERNIEMRVRQEEREISGLAHPGSLLKGIETLLRNAPGPRTAAPEEPAPAAAAAPAEPESQTSFSWEQPIVAPAAKASAWASKEELEKLAERAARIRERHESRKAAGELAEEAEDETVEPVVLATVTEMPPAIVDEPPIEFTPESEVETAAEPIDEVTRIAEAAFAELAEAPAAAIPESVETLQTELPAEAVRETPPPIETPESETPASAEAEATPVFAAEVEGGDLVERAELTEAAERIEPATVAELQPLASAPIPTFEARSGEPVAITEEPEAFPAGPELVMKPMATATVIPPTPEELIPQEQEQEQEQEPAIGESEFEPELLRVRVVSIDQTEAEPPAAPAEEGNVEAAVEAALETPSHPVAEPEAEPIVAEAPQEAIEPETIEPAAVEATETPVAGMVNGADINSLHESLVKEEAGLPAGLQPVEVLREQIRANAPFQGVAVSIGINDFESLQQKLDTPGGADSLASIEKMVRGMLKEPDFACRFQDDEYVLLFPGEADSAAQRRLFQISEKLWDFQLRSLGHHSIMFSWGGLEVKRDSLSDAVAAARERMFQTKRNRTGAIEMRKRVVNG